MSAVEAVKDKIFDAVEIFTSEKHVVAIKDGMMAYIPFTIIGAIALLVANFPFQPYIDFVTNILGLSDSTIWQNAVSSLNNGAMNIGSVICTLFIGYNLSKNYKNEVDPMLGGVVSLCMYLLLTPWDSFDGTTAIATSYFGTSSLIVGIFCGLLVPEVLRLLMKVDALKIKLPSQVPPMVAQSFSSLIPLALLSIAFLALKLLIGLTPYGNIHTLINTVLGIPLMGLAGSLGGYMVCLFFTNALSQSGIHGTSIIMGGVLGPFLLMLSDQNRIAAEAGAAIPNIITNEFLTYTGGIGLYLCIACLLVCRNSETRPLCKIALVPAIFGIHEPLVFGLPIMYNPYFAIPYVLFPMIGAGLTYVVTALGLVAPLSGVGVPWTMPPVLYGFLASGGQISTGVWQLILAVIYVLLAIPFAKAFDRSKLKAEKERQEELEGGSVAEA